MPLVDTSGISSSARSTWDLAFTIGRNAVWAPDPMTQIVTDIVIIALLILSSSVGFVAGIPLAIAAMMFLTLAVLRLLVGWVM